MRLDQQLALASSEQEPQRVLVLQQVLVQACRSVLEQEHTMVPKHNHRELRNHKQELTSSHRKHIRHLHNQPLRSRMQVQTMHNRIHRLHNRCHIHRRSLNVQGSPLAWIPSCRTAYLANRTSSF